MREQELYSLRQRMLPSPGCEADAAVVHTKEVGVVTSAAVAGAEGGSYAHGPLRLPSAEEAPAGGEVPDDDIERCRQIFMRREKNFKLKKIKM
eukprot:299567-Pyramimonas_sp.AAC.1